MERDTNQMSQSSALCRSGCGFYGSPATDGLCSKCYKDALKRKQSNPATAPTPSPGRNSPTVLSLSASASSPLPVSVETAPAASTSSPPTCVESTLSTASPTVPPIASAATQNQDSGKPEPGQDSSNLTEGAPATCTESSSGADGSEQADDTTPKEQKKKKNRCLVCRKKVGLTGFECRCGGLFCSLHRYSNEHNCTFDYKELGAQEIRKNNPLVVGEKIQKI